jgi:hypothetical protein
MGLNQKYILNGQSHEILRRFPFLNNWTSGDLGKKNRYFFNFFIDFFHLLLNYSLKGMTQQTRFALNWFKRIGPAKEDTTLDLRNVLNYP